MLPKKKLDALKPDMQKVAMITAQTGVSFFKGSFRTKSFGSKKWPEAKIDKAGKRRRGSLMVDSAGLMNSVRTSEITPERVTWAAGNDKVAYAEPHNTGGRAGRGKGFNMTQRQFMGDAEELNTRIDQRILSYFKTLFR